MASLHRPSPPRCIPAANCSPSVATGAVLSMARAVCLCILHFCNSSKPARPAMAAERAWGAGLEFSKLTGFPAERLLADPENETYSKLPFKQGALATFFSPKVSCKPCFCNDGKRNHHASQRVSDSGAAAGRVIAAKHVTDPAGCVWEALFARMQADCVLQPGVQYKRQPLRLTLAGCCADAHLHLAAHPEGRSVSPEGDPAQDQVVDSWERGPAGL